MAVQGALVVALRDIGLRLTAFVKGISLRREFSQTQH